MPSMPSHAHDNRAAAPGLHAHLYDAVYGAFRWQVPARFNMAQVCLRRWADGPDQAQALAVIEDGPTLTRPRRHSYGDLAAEFDPALVAELQQHVRGRLAPYEYPKEIEFIDALPMTTTGKVQRRVLRLQEEARARERASAAASA